jgi:hypothetical protein
MREGIRFEVIRMMFGKFRIIETDGFLVFNNY